MSSLFKHCGGCDASKPYGDFHAKATQCKVCARARAARWHNTNRERVREYSTQPATKQRHTEWKARNPDYYRLRFQNKRAHCLVLTRAWRQANPERVRALRQRWWKENADKSRLYVNRRRVRKVFGQGTHTHDEWLALIARCGGACVRCGQTVPLTRDHIVPLYCGGGDDISNIQPLCKPCNSSKGTKTINYMEAEYA